MKNLLIGLSFLILSVSSFAQTCEYGYRMNDLTIHKNYDPIAGNYDWQNEMWVTANNLDGLKLEDNGYVGWVHEVLGASDSQYTYNDDDTLLPLKIKNGKIEFRITIKDVDVVQDDIVVDKTISLEAKALPLWRNVMYIKENGLEFSYEIIKDCE